MEITIPIDYLWYGGIAIGTILIGAFLYGIRKTLYEWSVPIIILILISIGISAMVYSYHACPARDFRIWEILNKADKFGPKAKDALRKAYEDGYLSEPDINKIERAEIQDKIDECLTK